MQSLKFLALDLHDAYLFAHVSETTAPVQTNLWTEMPCILVPGLFRIFFAAMLLKLSTDLSASSNLALSSAHAKGRSNSLENLVFDNLLLNVHKTQFQVGAPICQKYLGL